MKVWTAAYMLTPRGLLGARAAAAPRCGCLMRLQRPDGAVGYADLHPWPELGDATVDEQIEGLRHRKPLPLAARSLLLAHQDAAARSANRPLINPAELPDNHFLLLGHGPACLAEAISAYESGFRWFKLKMGRELRVEANNLLQLCNRLPEAASFRLDFNESLSEEEVRVLLSGPLASILHRIDFIEDPCPPHSSAWPRIRRAFNVDLALDRSSTRLASSKAASVVVIKPATQAKDPILSTALVRSLRVVFTSYLDHPVGQMHAAYETSQAKSLASEQVVTAGLLSHLVYEPNAYSECLIFDGPRLRPAEGTGIGFDRLLEQESWRELR